CEDAQVASEREDSGRIRLAVTAPENGRLLIGAQGAHLQALEHVLHCALRHKFSWSIPVTVDVNEYRRERGSLLAERAREAAEQALTLKRAIVLEPMSAPDRRAVHTALGDNASVVTESLGEDPHRRVVIRPRS
ncbi:MAG: R3H domain-containing nucleic acid-binding protein, partial [Patescibacteria group bacterium]